MWNTARPLLLRLRRRRRTPRPFEVGHRCRAIWAGPIGPSARVLRLIVALLCPPSQSLCDDQDVTEKAFPFGSSPKSAVLYRTPERWRWAIYADGVYDGSLLTTPADSSVERAKSDFLAMLHEVQGVDYQATWHASVTDPPGRSSDWWDVDLVRVGGVT